MRKLVLLLGSSYLLFFILNNTPAYASGTLATNCLAITGKFTSTAWSGGNIMVGCDGDNGNNDGIANNDCVGQVLTVRPNQSFILRKCSCGIYADGCLKVGKTLTLKKDGPGNRPRVHGMTTVITNKCTISYNKNICGQNGHTITSNVKGVCVSTPTPTPMSTPTPTPSPTPVPTPTPICPVPGVVTNIKITCPDCLGTTPSPTPAPTSVGSSL